ncbi:MAG: fibronectin type III domain-containing protein [Candidatus Nitrosotenuis sp.]
MKTVGIVLILLVATLAAPMEHVFAQAAVSQPPTSLTAQAASASQINLSWAAPVNATNNGVNGYQIEQDVGCVGIFSVLVANTTTTTTSYQSTGLLSDFCYAYRVSALNSAGASAPSNTASATTLSTSNAPTGLVVTPVSSSSLRLAWNAPSDNGGSEITGYQIQRNGTILVANTANNQTTYLSTGLLPLHEQTYRVAAWNGVGLGTFSANVTAKTTNQTSTPGPIDKENLGQAISDFVHKRNELLKKQREETLKIIKECGEKVRSANGTQRKQIREDCREMLQDLKEKYKETRKQLKEEFKTFRETTKSLLKEARKTKLIEKEDVKEIKREFKEFKQETKKEEKEFKRDIKDAKKEFKKQLKELKNEEKKEKKDKRDDDEHEDDD